MMAGELDAELHAMGAVQNTHGIGPVNCRLILLAVVPVEPSEIGQPSLGERNTRDAICIRTVRQAELSCIPLISICQDIPVAIHSDARLVQQLRAKDMRIAK